METRLIYADSENCADMYYASRFFAPDPFLYLRDTSGISHLATSILEIDRARRTAQTTRFHDWTDLQKRFDTTHPNHPKREEDGRLIVFLLQDLNINQVQVPNAFPLGLAQKLTNAGISVTALPDPFWPEREQKQPEEVAAIEQALEITAQGMTAGIDMIRKASISDDGGLWLDGAPLTSERVRGEINATLVRLGAIPRHTIVSGGAQGADPHERGYGPLPAHQPIILDVFPRVETSGYWGDMTRTVCRGRASDQVKKAWAAVEAAQKLAVSRIRAGVSGLAVHEAVSDLLTEAGFATGVDAQGRQEGFFHGTGHGLGLEIHEAPRISRRDQTLQSGHVITVEPGLYYQEMGGVRLEDVVVVEENGCRNLTRMPKFLEI